MDNFGMIKVGLPVEFNNISVFAVHKDSMTYLYTKEGNLMLYYRFTNISQCSTIDIGHVYVKSNISAEYAAALPHMLKGLYGSKTVISRQNSTKDGFTALLKLGFIDMYRVPGNYINPSRHTGVKEKRESCISLMVLGDPADLLASAKRTLDLLKKNYLGIFDATVPTKVPSVVPKVKPRDKVYICMAPTATLTRYKLYKGTACIDGSKLCVKNDNGTTITIDEKRFILTL